MTGTLSAPRSRDRTAGWMLVASVPLLIGGLVMPAVSVTTMALFGETYSILEGVVAFWEDERYGLFLLVFAFSVILPSAKLAIGLWAWASTGERGAVLDWLLRTVAAISKWSMLDVFIVALLVVALEGSLLTTADIHAGIILFAAAVVTSTIGTHRLVAR